MTLFLLTLLILGAILFLIVLFKDYRTAKRNSLLEKKGNIFVIGFTGFLVCFFDTLGLGGFAPLTAVFKHFQWVKDRVIPGTLNTALCIPITMEALIFIKAVPVDTTTLLSMLVAAVLGAVCGTRIVTKLEEQKIQFGIAIALLAVLLFMLAGKLGLLPPGGDAIGLTGLKLCIAVVGNFVLGALMTLGIGLYAPCMALVYALGLSPLAAFPIMMGSCAFLMPVASINFIKANAYNRRCTMIISLTGIFGVLIAAGLVKSLSLSLLTWFIMAVIGYTSLRLFMQTRTRKPNE